MPLAPLLALALHASPAWAQDDPGPPETGGAVVALASSQGAAPDDRLAFQDALSSWWSAAGRMWLDESAYRVVEPVPFQDGLCSATLREGMVIPVWAGKPPLSERIVGFVFVGEGDLEVQVPLRADRWRIANHAARHGVLSAPEQAEIAGGRAPLRLGIDRGLVLSADPAVRELLVGLEPVGGGTMIRSLEDEQGEVDEAYIVTEGRGKLKVKAIATNLLPQRRLQLQRAGLDPRMWLRQDRLLHDELGMEGQALRLVADWRTDRPLHVAAELGAGVGNDEYDRWLACFRDPMDQEGLGFHSQAFAHGTDPQGERHFERLSGQPLPPPEERPGAWMEGVKADVTVSSRPKGMGSERFVDVDAVIELRAVGGPTRAVTLAMPVNGPVRGSWRLESLTLEDDAPLARVGLSEDLTGRGDAVAGLEVEAEAEDGAVAEVDVDEGSADSAELTGGSVGARVPAVGGLGGAADSGNQVAAATSGPTMDTELASPEAVISGIEADQGLGAVAEGVLVKDSPIEHHVQVVLPEVVPEGGTVRLRVRWKARWPFANWSSYGRPLGTTTGMQPLLPQPVPSPGQPRWDSTIRVGVPAAGLSVVAVAITGDTTREWDEDTWTWTEAQGVGVAEPAVAIGRWESQVDQAGSGMPGVRAHLFVGDAWALPQFPPEVRRVVAFMERFMPDLPMEEVEVFQGASGLASTVLRGEAPGGGHGLVEVQTIRPAAQSMGADAVTQQGQIDEADPYLAQTMVARQVARQFWGEALPPATARDRWLTEGLADAYAGFYIRAAFGNDAYTERMEALRALVEDPTERASTAGQVNRYRRFLSLSGATPASDVPAAMRHRYGAYLLGDVLRLRLGDQAYFAAIDKLATERGARPVTSEDLQQALEQASGQDLSELFDFWVHGGFVPELEVQYSVEAGADGRQVVHGCVLSSVPWGSFEVPIEVKDRGGARSVSALVDVDDGRGAFDLGDREGEVEVLADPLGLVVAYARKVRKVARTACDGG